MNILILGGTQFIGRNLVMRLLAEGKHTLTLFNRQRTGTGLFPEAQTIKGDRDTDDIHQIAAQHWDYVIDLSGYFPAQLQASLGSLSKKPKKYIFISTCSVYESSNPEVLKSEDAPMLSCTAALAVDQSPATYGNRKAGCEQILQESGIEYLILRPSLVVGPYDHTDRFYYWLYQVKKHETLVVPNLGASVFSIVYVHDLVDVILQALQTDSPSGIYTMISVPEASIGAIVDHASAQLGKAPKLMNASPDYLESKGIKQWVDMPLWLDGNHFTYSNNKLVNDFNFQPTSLGVAISETIAYFDALGWPEPTYGISETARIDLIKDLKPPE